MISCQLIDYLNTACHQQLPLQLTLSNGQSTQGIAIQLADTHSDKPKLVLMIHTQYQQIEVSNIAELIELEQHTQFEQLEFA